MTTHLNSVSGANVGTTCLICDRSDITPNTVVNPRDFKVFHKFCRDYLKVDEEYLSYLLAEHGRSVEQSICEGCGEFVRKIGTIYEEWDNIKLQLLRIVCTLGTRIGDGTDLKRRHWNEVKNKCLLKSSSLLPVVNVSLLPGNDKEFKEEKAEIDFITESQDSTDLEDDTDPEPEIKGVYLSSPPSSPFDQESAIPQGSRLKRYSKPKFRNNIVQLNAFPKGTDPDGPNNARIKINVRPQKRTCSSKKRKWEDEIQSDQLPALASSSSSNEPTSPHREHDEKRLLGNNTDATLNERSLANFPKFKCSECPRVFKRRSNLLRHCIDVHDELDGINLRECSLCFKSHSNISSLQTHLREEHDNHEKDNFCVQCSEAFATQQLADIHRVLTHVEYSPITCEVEDCHESFISMTKYGIHLRTHVSDQGSVFTCDQCGIVYRSNQHLQLHKFVHLSPKDEGYFACSSEDCSYKCRYANKLMNHYNNLHVELPLKIEMFCCKICKHVPWFLFKKDLLAHQSIHSTTTRCLFCDETFVGRNALNVHRFMKHKDQLKGNLSNIQTFPSAEPPPKSIEVAENSSEQSRSCLYCQETFTTFYELLKHKVNVHGQTSHLSSRERVPCHKCGVSVTKGQLQVHLKCHEDPDLNCPHPGCTARFRKRHNLKYHLKAVHEKNSSQRQFVCEDCGKGYLNNGQLNRHRLTHSAKRFKCRLCSKAYSNISQINVHIQAVHTNEKFYCKWCSTVCSYLTKLKTHVKNKHPDKLEELKKIYTYSSKPSIHCIELDADGNSKERETS